jgi:hypothetical protein
MCKKYTCDNLDMMEIQKKEAKKIYSWSTSLKGKNNAGFVRESDLHL